MLLIYSKLPSILQKLQNSYLLEQPCRTFLLTLTGNVALLLFRTTARSSRKGIRWAEITAKTQDQEQHFDRTVEEVEG